MLSLRRLFQPSDPIPTEYRRNFLHLYFDIGWWGLLNGSILVFLQIYASRLGATAFQLGLLTAAPAVVNLLFTFPAGSLTRKWSTASTVRWSALLMRSFYFLLILLPVLFPAGTQIWLIILITLLMNIPGVMVAVLFNAFFAEVTPPEWRGHVAGTRNAIFAITSLVTALVSGLALEKLPFETGYQVVFAIGFLGAMMSTVHLFLIRPPAREAAPSNLTEQVSQELEEAKQTGMRTSRWQALRLDVLTGPFWRIIVITFLFQTALYFIGPVVPRYQVDNLKLTDGVISLGSAIFWTMNFVGSIQVRKWSSRWGFRRLTAYGMFIASVTLTIFTFSFETGIYLLHQFIGGVGFAMMNGGMVNYVLDHVPVDDRPSHLAWYNLAVNAAILMSGFLAPPVAGLISIMGVLLVSVGLRVVVGWVILKHGE